MVSDYREIRPQGSPHIPQWPSYGFLAEQPRFASYMGPEPGRTPQQHFQGDHRQHSPHCYPHFRGDHHQQSPHPYPQFRGDHHQQIPHPYLHPRPSSLPYSNDMHEAIQREIEKERIREEIIKSEIERRRELEAEVRRELMMERELALRRGSNGFLFSSPSVMGFDSSMRLPLMEPRAEGRSLEERIILSLADRDRLNGRHESGGVEPLPFQRGSAGVRTSEAKPVAEGAKEKEKIILLAKPKENISGVKREASKVDATESPLDRKKAKEEWSCALCHVSTTSEQALNEHLQGKKHKLKEAALRGQKGGKNYSIGLFPKKAAKAIQSPGTVNPGTVNEVKLTSESLPVSKTQATRSETGDPLSLQEKVSSENSKKNEEPAVAQEVQKDNNPEMKRMRFWCELCQVGAPSRKVMNHHEKGKKHKRRLHKSNTNSGVGSSNEKDGGVDENTAEKGGAGDQPVEEEKTMAEEGGAVDITSEMMT